MKVDQTFWTFTYDIFWFLFYLEKKKKHRIIRWRSYVKWQISKLMRKKSFLANEFLLNPITAERSKTVKHIFKWRWIKFDRLLCNEKKLKIFFQLVIQIPGVTLTTTLRNHFWEDHNSFPGTYAAINLAMN